MMQVATGRISRLLTFEGNWRSQVGPKTMSGDEYIFGADAFAVPDYGIFGAAYSYHPYDHYPLAQRDVQLAFDTIRAAVRTHSPGADTDNTFLKELLPAVAQAFAELNEPPDDHRTSPWVQIAVVRLQGGRLSIARMGNVRVYVINPDEYWEMFQWGGPNRVVSAALKPDLDPSEVELRDRQVRTGELVVVATDSMQEVVRGANLSDLSGVGTRDPEVVSQRLIDTLKSQPGANDPAGTERPGRWTEYFVRAWGAAWAIACVEANEDIPQEKATSKRRPRKVERPTRPHQEESAPDEDVEIPMFNLHLLQTGLSVKEYQEVASQLTSFHPEPYLNQLPAYLIARCPFCSVENVERLNTYSLRGWYLGYGKSVFDFRCVIHHCEHFALTQPFFHFHGIWPEEAKGEFGSEVPYVIGHLLESGQCLAVIHALPVCRIEGQSFVPRYTLFIVTYFSQQPEEAFNSVIAYNAPYLEPGVILIFPFAPGGRGSTQEHWWNLRQWVSAGQLFWVDGDDPALGIRTHDIEAFPYGDIRGRTYFHIFPYPLPKPRKTKSKRKPKAPRK